MVIRPLLTAFSQSENAWGNSAALLGGVARNAIAFWGVDIGFVSLNSRSRVVSAIKNPKLFRASLIRWFRKSGRALPWRGTRDPYAIWISEIMLQQTQVVTVVDYFERWMKRFPGIDTLAAAPEEEVLRLWQGLGYYSRARNLHRAAQIVAQTHGGKIPAEPDEIQKLPGVGRYTAGAIATFAFDVPTPIVEANIARVLARLLDMRTPVDSTKGQAILWGQAEALQPKRNAGLHNSALMELGALICLPRLPKCAVCPVRTFCSAGAPEFLPVKKTRRKTVELTEQCAWIARRGRVLLEQQTGSRWHGLWKLPQLHKSPPATPPILSLTYPFTHHRVTLSVFLQDAPSAVTTRQRWVKIKDLDQVAMTAPHRRAVEKLEALATGSIPVQNSGFNGAA